MQQPSPIPFPRIPNINAESPAAAAMSPGSVEEKQLFRNRDQINRQLNLRRILDAYCTSD